MLTDRIRKVIFKAKDSIKENKDLKN